MRLVRITLAIMLMAGASWLNWWVLPAMGMFGLARDGHPLPMTGYAIVCFEKGEYIGACSLQAVRTGWAGVWAAWPYSATGLLLGLACGYPLGELARRKLAIEQASAEALRASKAMADAAWDKEYRAECMVRRAQALQAEAARMKQELSREREQIRTMRHQAEERLQSGEEMLRRGAAVEKELAKAKAKIRRLTEKSGRRGQEPHAWIDIDSVP